MKNVTTSAIETLVANKAQAIVNKGALSTKGLVIDGKPATINDLTNRQITEAISAVNFSVKATDRQQRLDFVADCVANALLVIYENDSYAWDSTKASFFSHLRNLTKQQVMKGTQLATYKRENVSYSQSGQDDEGNEGEFSYGASDNTFAEVENELDFDVILAKFNSKEKEYIKLVLHNTKVEESEMLSNEEMAELLGFVDYDSMRVWKSKFLKKYNLAELVKSMANEKNRAFREKYKAQKQNA